MWENFEARLDENDPRYAAQRHTYLELIRGAGLRPGDGHAKKMLPFKFGAGELLLWGIEGSARNFYLHPKWEPLLKGESFNCEKKPFDPNKGAGGGRHTGLNSSWAFENGPCLVVPIDSDDALRRLMAVLLQSGDALMLNPAAITRWIERLRHFFPAFDRFDPPDPHFEQAETPDDRFHLQVQRLGNIGRRHPAIHGPRDHPMLLDRRNPVDPLVVGIGVVVSGDQAFADARSAPVRATNAPARMINRWAHRRQRQTPAATHYGIGRADA